MRNILGSDGGLDMTADEWLFDACRCVAAMAMACVGDWSGYALRINALRINVLHRPPSTGRYEDVEDVRAALDAGADVNAGTPHRPSIMCQCLCMMCVLLVGAHMRLDGAALSVARAGSALLRARAGCYTAIVTFAAILTCVHEQLMIKDELRFSLRLPTGWLIPLLW